MHLDFPTQELVDIIISLLVSDLIVSLLILLPDENGSINEEPVLSTALFTAHQWFLDSDKLLEAFMDAYPYFNFFDTISSENQVHLFWLDDRKYSKTFSRHISL